MTCDITDVPETPWECLLSGYLDSTGELQLGLLFSLMIVVPLYVKYEDPVMPAVGLGLVAGVAWPLLPAFAQGVAWVMIFAAVTMAVFTAVYRTMLS